MDPLSVTSGVIAFLTASGTTLQGLQKISELRHREKDFSRLWHSVNGIRALMCSAEILLKSMEGCNVEAECLNDCIGIINIYCGHLIEVFSELDDLLHNIGSKKDKMEPSKVRWIFQKPRLLDLMNQITNATLTLTTALKILQGIKIATMTKGASAGVDALLSRLQEFDASPKFDNPNPPCPLAGGGSRPLVQKPVVPAISNTSGLQSYSADSEAFAGSRSSLTKRFTCDNYCQCQCHTISRFRNSSWNSYVLGTFSFYGNSSIWLQPKTCNKKSCHQGSVRVQFSYRGPHWTVLRNLVIYANAQLIGGRIPTYYFSLPRTIPFNAAVWGIVEMGNVSELQKLLLLRQASPYDMNLDGTSLLKVYKFYTKHNAKSLLVCASQKST